MKHFMTAAALVASLFTTMSAEAAPSRRQTIGAAAQLQRTASYFSNFARYYSHPKTARFMRIIAIEAGNVEKAAWQGNLFEAQAAVNRAVNTYIDARIPLSEIPYYRRNYIESHVNHALNRMLRVFDETVPLNYSAPCRSEGACTQGYSYKPRTIAQGSGNWASGEGDLSSDWKPTPSDDLPADDRFNDNGTSDDRFNDSGTSLGGGSSGGFDP